MKFCRRYWQCFSGAVLTRSLLLACWRWALPTCRWTTAGSSSLVCGEVGGEGGRERKRDDCGDVFSFKDDVEDCYKMMGKDMKALVMRLAEDNCVYFHNER